MRFIVKLGTNLITNPTSNEAHTLNEGLIESVAEQIASLHKQGHEPLIVTSGAVASGRQSLSLAKETKTIPYRQVLAAIGQTHLLKTYQSAFQKHGLLIGQVLLTMADFERRSNFISTRNTLELMLKNRIIPVVNENDVTTFEELKFGDNDNLSARLASMVNADRLLLLTDVEGVYDEDPKQNPKAALIPEIAEITEEILAKARPTSSSKQSRQRSYSRGGMMSKLTAAEFATEAGVTVWIAHGETPDIILDLILDRKSHGTRFKAKFTPREARHHWLKAQCLKGCAVYLDAGAKNALLKNGKSLLASGVVRVEGKFERGAVVPILGHEGEKIGFGQVNYGSIELEKIKGKKSSEIEGILGYVWEEEVIHRDNMVVKG